MALLNRKAFERKLQNMSSAQDSVQTVSLWMIHHKKHAEDMVIVWLDQLKKASKADRRLVLFYLANDVLQNSRKKGKEFSNAFTKILREAMQLLSEKTIKGNVERVIKIWEERKLFEKDYLEALRSKLASGDVTAVISKKPKEKPVEKEKEKEKEKEVKPAKQKRLPPADFKPSKLIDALKALRNFEGELTLKESQLNSLRIDASDLESVRQLKDRTGGGKFCEEYELATATLEEFLETLRREQEERKNIIKVLEDGEAFCDVSYGEVKVIVHAYKTFGNRLTSLKKKVDGKVNRLAQKEAEKAKTGPVSAPQASFLTSGLPDVAEGSAPSTPTQGQQASSDEAKAVDPTVDNIEVADMDIEDDSDSERSETSEEASAEDPKSSNDQTPNSTGSSDSQPTQSTTQELDITPVISPVPTVAPARPLTPNLGTMVPIQGSIMPNQTQIVPPRPQVPMVTHPFMGVQSVRFQAHAPQFRPGVPPIQPLPGMAQNQLLQPSGTLPVPGQITGQGQPFSQIPRPAGLLPSSNAPLAGGMGSVQPFPLGTGFVHSQAPLPVAAATVPVPVQVITNSAAATDSMKDNASRPQGVFDVGSPDSEASAPSPVGSPELHLAEGDETPETTPAPLGDVNVNDNTGFQTNKSFFENPVKNPTTSLGPGFSGTQSVSKTLSESPSSSSSTPSIPDQTGGQDSALVKKDNGQKVSAVDILAQLLSRGRKMQQPNETDTKSVPITTPVPSSIAAPVAPQQNSDKPQSKPLLSLIDSLFPKLSDSIKTLKEKEKVVNSSQFNTPVSATSLPAQPLPSESHFPHPSNVGSEQPEFPQSGLKSILKRGPKSDDEVLTPGQTSQVFRPNDGAFERPSMDHAAVPNVPHQGPVGVDPTLIFPEERPLGKSVENERNDPGPEPRHNQQQGNRINVIDSSPAATSPTHLSRQGPPLRGGSPRFPQERPFDRPLDMSPRGMSPFGPRLPFQDAHGPHFQRSRDNVGPPVERHEGPPDMPGRVPPEQPLRGHSPRGAFRDGPLRGPSDTSNVHQEHYTEKTAPTNLPDVPSEDVHAGKPRNVEEAFVNGPPGMKRPPVEGAPIHRPDPRRSPHEQVPRADGPPPHRASYPGAMDDVQRRREFERWEEHRREPFFDHRRGPWDFPQDHPGPPPPDWRGPPLSPRGDPKRADFREDDPSMWTSFESPGRSPRTYERFREGPPEFDRFHGYGPPDRRRHSVGDFESERMYFPLKRPGPPPVPFPGPAKRPYY